MSARPPQQSGPAVGRQPSGRRKSRRLLKAVIVVTAVAGFGVQLYFLVPPVRAWVVEQAARLGTPALPFVLRAMNDPDADVRQQARAELRHMEGALPWLEERALRDPDPAARIRAIEGLAEVPHAGEALPTLDKALGDPDPAVRRAAIRTEASLTRGTNHSVPVLLKVLTRPGEEPEVRAEAAEAIGRLGPVAKEAIPVLVQALKDPEERVREEAADALGGVGVGSGEALLALTDVLDDPEPEVRQQAQESMQRIRVEDVRPLVKRLGNRKPHDRVTAALALRVLRPHGEVLPEVTAALQVALKDEDERVRTEADLALRALQAPATEPPDGPP